jgi:hypothetical protein
MNFYPFSFGHNGMVEIRLPLFLIFVDLQIYREVAQVIVDSFKRFMKLMNERCDQDPIKAELPFYVSYKSSKFFNVNIKPIPHLLHGYVVRHTNFWK